MKKIVSAGLVLFRCQNNIPYYLLLRYIGGHWDFAKGKLEPGEAKEQAALRELKEETGLDAVLYKGFEDSISYVFTDLDRQRAHKTVEMMVAQTDGNDITLSDEHIDYAWLPYEQALARLTYKNAKNVLTKAQAFIATIE